MDIEQWWPKLSAPTRLWLTDHNGEAVPAEIVAEIANAGAVFSPGAWWVGGADTAGFLFSDAAIDWIEATANGETPEAPTA